MRSLLANISSRFPTPEGFCGFDSTKWLGFNRLAVAFSNSRTGPNARSGAVENKLPTIVIEKRTFGQGIKPWSGDLVPLMRDKPSLFEELFLPHLDAAYNLARWIVERDQDAQDVVQEAYVRALKGFKGFRGANARAWLLTIVRNTAYSWTRKHPSNIIPFDEAIHSAQMEEPVSESWHEERKRQLYEALNRLSVDFREVLVLYEIEGWSYKQIASALNVPVGTIMSRLSRARRRLQEELAGAQDAKVQNEL